METSITTGKQQILSVENLGVSFGDAQAVRDVSLKIDRGETLGVVGESGSGKSVTFLAAMGLLPRTARTSGKVVFFGQNLLELPEKKMTTIRGGRIAMIPQDPGSAMNPMMRVGRQIVEALRLHRGFSGQAARAEACRLLDQVGIPDAAARLDRYPFEFSGGQKQRLMIAMALAGQPDLLIADEPTTALDVTIQAQILELLLQIQRDNGMAMVLISHDLGVIAQTCRRVAVMYAGRVVEVGSSAALFRDPAHPYAQGLLQSLPTLAGPRQRLRAIAGTVPSARALPAGCAFAPRCDLARDACSSSDPELKEIGPQRYIACAPVFLARRNGLVLGKRADARVHA